MTTKDDKNLENEMKKNVTLPFSTFVFVVVIVVAFIVSLTFNER